MKYFAVFLLLCAVALAADKPYYGVIITIDSSRINGNGVRLIEATEQSPSRTAFQLRHFTFNCNADIRTCSTPEIGGIYAVGIRQAPVYKCDNYQLVNIERPLIDTCLADVY